MWKFLVSRCLCLVSEIKHWLDKCVVSREPKVSRKYLKMKNSWFLTLQTQFTPLTPSTTSWYQYRLWFAKMKNNFSFCDLHAKLKFFFVIYQFPLWFSSSSCPRLHDNFSSINLFIVFPFTRCRIIISHASDWKIKVKTSYNFSDV